ncbi:MULTISPECIES: hypothetical protein [Eubacteriales]|uniref:Uncharacterized protein n=1 Tax=Clostridium isatidis TaxID=182773 RepID=A0A343JA24_9CLOT|nr:MULTISPECIES: hypothetical protein [Eubacteriales]ASW42382.1 hypothetical protein BEN51_02435 [Clostridium isatidis]MBU5455002.1 hypothetical protein [Caproiciproducens sp. MSJ-32]NLZ34609.1 hypothetical protein [Clostridiales bacterium]
MTVRCTIIKVKKDYYIGKNLYTNKTFKIIKNQHIRELKRNDDYEFYCKREKGLFRDILIPISEEEAFKMAD